MNDCCKGKTTTFCEECGEAVSPIQRLLKHLRREQAHFDQKGYTVSAARWESFGDSLEALIEKAKETER